jgi:hypothetical protein
MTITSTAQILDYLATMKGSYYYRGYSRDEQLVATMGRCYNSHFIDNNPVFEYKSYKQLALSLLTIRSDFTFSQVIQIGQHYGLPTRYIDFTEDPNVALYFGHNNGNNHRFSIACTSSSISPLQNEHIEEELKDEQTTSSDMDDLTFGELDPLKLFDLDSLHPNEPLSKEYVESQLFERIFSRYFYQQAEYTLLQYNADSQNPNAVAQKGLFIVMRDYKRQIPATLFDKISVELDDDEGKVLRKHLRDVGICKKRLFPKDKYSQKVKCIVCGILGRKTICKFICSCI